MTSEVAAAPARTGWAARLGGERQERALDAARLIASRVTRPDAVAASVRLAREQTHYPMSVHWNPATLAQGDAGQALLADQLDRVWPGAGWAEVAQEHLGRAAAFHRRAAGRRVGLISGAAGLAWAIRRVGAERHQALVAELDGATAQAALAEAARIRGRSGLTVSSYDLISGLSGVLLAMLPTEDQPRPSPALRFLVRALCELVLSPGDLPAWHTPVDLLYDDDLRRQYPHGYLNVGLAHGAPGILAALSLAQLSGHRAERLEPAIRTLAEWLRRHTGGAADHPVWPTAVRLAAGDRTLQVVDACEQSRDAWCYGTPGVARAMYLAGTALDEAGWRAAASAAMAGVYARPVPDRAIDSATFCHGVAGLLQITLRFAQDTGEPGYDDAATALTEQILSAVDPRRPMGVANTEPGDNLVDQPGLLDGATGVCLVLLAAATDVDPGWDRIFGLA